MKKTLKRIISLTLTVLMLTTAVSTGGLNVSAAEISGQNGELSYSFDGESGMLTISGNGEFDGSLWSDSEIESTAIKNVTVNDGITGIGKKAFYGCKELIGVQMPSSLKSIGYAAFENCFKLERINIPDGVSNISDRSFYGCVELTEITIPTGVTYIGNGTFNGCRSLTSITIPDSVTSLGEFALYGCKGLTDIVLPAKLMNLGDYAFGNCTKLTDITIPDRVTSIGKSVFYGCSSMTDVSIPEGVKSIGESAFRLCSKLKSITLPDVLTSIGKYAFSSCFALKEISITQNVVSIGDYAFLNCTGLSNVTIPNNVESIGTGIFYYCSALTDATISDKITNIPNYTFFNCSSLKNVTLSNNVTGIGRYAFAGSKITKIAIPVSVTYIGEHAFDDCDNLELACIIRDDAKIEKNAFPNNNKIQLFVQKDSELCEELLNEKYNVIPYSLTERTYNGKAILSIDRRIVLSEDVWSCICRLVKDCEVYYIYFETLDFGDMMPEEVLKNADKSELVYEQVLFSIVKDGETVLLGSVDEKKTFAEIIESLAENFIIGTAKIISAVIRYIFKKFK